MEHVTALVDHDATTPAPAGIEVQFLNLITRSAEVRRRTFATEEAALTWLAEVRSMVELVAVTPVGGHVHMCLACIDDEVDDEVDEAGVSTVEPYDVARDDALTDAA